MHKILAMMLMLGAVSVLITAMSSMEIRSLKSSYGQLVDNRLPAIQQLIRSHRQGTEIVKHGMEALLAGAGTGAARQARELADGSLAEAEKSLAKAAELDPALAPETADVRASFQEVHRLTLQALERDRAGDRAGALRVLASADARFDRTGERLRAGNEQRTAAAAAETAELQERTNRKILIALLASLLGTAFALFIAHRVVRGSIIRPMLELNGEMSVLASGDHKLTIRHAGRKDEIGTMSRSVQVFRDQAEERAKLAEQKKQADAEQEHVVKTLGTHLDRLAAGDVSSEIGEQFPDSYRQLRTAFNAAMRSLGELIASVRDSTAEIRTGSSEIAQASEDLARRTESNAASLEETSAAIVQMDGRLKATAKASAETVGRADQAIATVTGGREVAEEAVQAMGRVADSAKGIDSVIEGLDKIAFQTRVLAMNAAVEAGRAGEAGRGFAVVADLVSALAMRAEEEAKRARDQLTVTQTDIVTAVGAVEKVDAALQNISADVGEVHQLLGSMANDNQAQAHAISEINAAVTSMDQSTQQNAAMVEQTSAAARNLMNEVTSLANQAARFRCSSARGDARPASSPAPARGSALPRIGKEGFYQSPVRPLGPAAVQALVRPDADDWKEF